MTESGKVRWPENPTHTHSCIEQFALARSDVKRIAQEAYNELEPCKSETPHIQKRIENTLKKLEVLKDG